MNVVVTGAAGFIGSHLSAALVSTGSEVRGIDSLDGTLYPRQAKVKNLGRIPENGRFSFYEENLSEGEVGEHVAWADVVVHAAALPGLVFSWQHFDKYVDSNLRATRSLLEALRRNPMTHLVFASTSSVYGRFASGDEHTQLKPVSPYGVTKLAAENLVEAYRANFGVSATVLRYFSVYGPGQRPDMAYAKFCRLLIEGSELNLTGDGTQSRSNTYISDVIEATLVAVDRQLDGLTANICGNDVISLNEAVSVLAANLGVRPKLTYVDSVPGDQYETRGDASLAREQLGWTPRVTIHEGLKAQAEAALASQGL